MNTPRLFLIGYNCFIVFSLYLQRHYNRIIFPIILKNFFPFKINLSSYKTPPQTTDFSIYAFRLRSFFLDKSGTAIILLGIHGNAFTENFFCQRNLVSKNTFRAFNSNGSDSFILIKNIKQIK